MDDCLFCRIAAREMDAEIVAERPTALAFRDINPQAPVHVLIIPREHVTGMKRLGTGNGNALADIFTLINDVAVSEGIERSGYRVVCNVGVQAGQEVPHLHFHILGGRNLGWPPG